MTRPRSWGATSRSRCTTASSVHSSTRTRLGSSTSSRAIASSSSRISLLLGRRGLRRLVLLLQQAAHGVAGLRALADPVPCALGVDLDHRGVLPRVVVSQHLDEAPVAPRARVRDHDAVMRFLGGAGTSQTNRQHHVSWLIKAGGALTRHPDGRSHCGLHRTAWLRPPLPPPSQRRRAARAVVLYVALCLGPLPCPVLSHRPGCPFILIPAGIAVAFSLRVS